MLQTVKLHGVSFGAWLLFGEVVEAVPTPACPPLHTAAALQPLSPPHNRLEAWVLWATAVSAATQNAWVWALQHGFTLSSQLRKKRKSSSSSSSSIPNSVLTTADEIINGRIYEIKLECAFTTGDKIREGIIKTGLPRGWGVNPPEERNSLSMLSLSVACSSLL